MSELSDLDAAREALDGAFLGGFDNAVTVSNNFINIFNSFPPDTGFSAQNMKAFSDVTNFLAMVAEKSNQEGAE